MALSEDDGSRQAERMARIAELEDNLQRRTPVGVRLPVALLAMGLAGYFLVQYRGDLAYYFSSQVPITLGAEGDYHFDQLRSNRYAQVHGVPTLKGGYSQVHGQTRVLVGFQETPLLVYRPALPGEVWEPGHPPPVPNQNPFAVRGRLLSQADAPARYKAYFTQLGAREHVFAREGQLWLLMEGDRPGADLTNLLLPLLLVLFLVFNASLVVADVRHRLAARG